MWRLFFVFVVASVTNAQNLGGPTHGKTVLCYWPSWTYYNPVEGQPRFQLSTVDPSLCTHLVYFNAYYDIDKNILKTQDPFLDLKKDNGVGNYLGVTGLKKSYPHLKVMITIGDLNNGPVTFSKMSADPEKRKLFVRNVKRFMKHFGFDGLDINWLYPTSKGGAPGDKENFVQLAKELSEAFKSRGYILAATIGTQESTMQNSYDLENLSRYLDLVLLRSWNYHDTGDGVVGASSPLRGVDDEDNLSVEFTVKYVLSHKVAREKVLMGIAFHGRTYVLRDQFENYIEFGDTPTTYDGFQGPYSGVNGFMDYLEICLALSNETSPWKYNWEENSATPYLRDKGRLISYDNARSIAHKIKLAIDNDLAGVLAWSMDADDYLAICTPESHHIAEAYEDFTERLNNIASDPTLGEALKNLNIPNESQFDADSDKPSYVISNGKLKLQLPKLDKKVKLVLSRFINDVTALAIQEKNIFDEIKRIKKDNESKP